MFIILNKSPSKFIICRCTSTISYQGLQHHPDYSSLDRFENLADKRGEYLVRTGLTPEYSTLDWYHPESFVPHLIVVLMKKISKTKSTGKVTSAARVQASKEVQSYSLKK